LIDLFLYEDEQQIFNALSVLLNSGCL